MSGEKPGVRESISRMTGELVGSGVPVEKAREIARGSAERVEHGSKSPTENRPRR